MLRLKYEKQSLQTYIEKQVIQIHTFDKNIVTLNFKLILLVLLLS